jgi:hypothetical protein
MGWRCRRGALAPLVLEACGDDDDGNPALIDADACNGRVFSLKAEGGVLVDGPTDVSADIDPDDRLVKITSFGQDATGELYIMDRTIGRFFHIAAGP